MHSYCANAAKSVINKKSKGQADHLPFSTQ